MKLQNRDWLDSPWKQFFPDNGHAPLSDEVPATGVSEEVLGRIAKQFASCPDDFNLHSGVCVCVCVCVVDPSLPHWMA